MKNKIFWSKEAEHDITDIIYNTKSDSVLESQRVKFNFDICVRSLSMFPKLGKKVLKDCKLEIREIKYKNYKICYLLKRSQILVLRVLHSLRDIEY